MAAGADSIDDLDVIRSGGMPRLFGEVYAPATLGQFLRECLGVRGRSSWEAFRFGLSLILRRATGDRTVP